MELTYAIGDIHGCSEKLVQLLATIETHRASRARRLVFVGDYVDRGPDSAGVIRILRDLQTAEPDRVTCLMGNHEEMMLNAYKTGLGFAAWQENGGGFTLASYGVEDPESLPHEVLAWMSGLPTVFEDAWRWFVHAGFRPGVKAPDPDIEARLWIREPFLSADYDFGKLVVHGHSSRRDGRPEVLAHRLDIDTGAVFGEKLTAAMFTDDAAAAIDFLQV